MDILKHVDDTANDATFTYMQDDDGYWYCVSGTYKGLYSESEDIGPFDSLEEAEEDAADYFNRYNEEG